MNKRYIKRLSLLSLPLLLFAVSCTTKPMVVPAGSDPLSVLPAGEHYYLLARPSEHPELIFEVLRDILPLSTGELYPALKRTSRARISGTFAKSLQFSGSLDGSFPAYFMRRSLKKSPYWKKEEGRVYKGPQDILADTLYKNMILAASDSERLDRLQLSQIASVSQKPVLTAVDKEWWLSGTPALLFYIPDLTFLPLPEGVPKVPGGTSMVLSLTPLSGGETYVLSADFKFKDARSARIWNLGLRIFLAGRLGLSVNPEEREAMTALTLKTDNSDIHLKNWTMTARGWGQFFSSFSEAF